MALPPDFKDLLREFADAEVRYLIVGGYAVSFHAAPRFTKDLDLWLEDTPENIGRTKLALSRFGAPAQVLEALEEARDLDVVWMGNPPMRVDLMKAIPGGSFAQAWPHRSSAEWDGIPVVLIGRDELLDAKRASGREQDLLDAALLEKAKPPGE